MTELRNRDNSWPFPLLVLLPTLLLGGHLGTAGAQDPTSPEDQLALAVAKGRVTFRVYCANCHGSTAKGDGQLAELLKVAPSDLTAITARNDGSFPAEAVHATIDGRDEVKGHGSRDMPIWGDAFQKTLQPTWKEVSPEERAQEKIADLVAYLKSIQIR